MACKLLIRSVQPTAAHPTGLTAPAEPCAVQRRDAEHAEKETKVFTTDSTKLTEIPRIEDRG